MKLLILFVVNLTFFSFYHSVVFGDDFKRDYVNLAKLTPEEEKTVIKLAYECGLKKPVYKIFSIANLFNLGSYVGYKSLSINIYIQ